MRSLMMSCWLLRNRRPSVRKPIAGAHDWIVDLIGGELGDDELVERPIGVEAGDDPIAIGVGMLVVAVFFEDVALGVGVAGDVEPVAGPAFAEARRGEQPIDGGFVAGIARVGGEFVELFGRRRQADEVVVQAVAAGPAARLRRRREVGRFELGQNEAIDIGRAANRDSSTSAASTRCGG